MTPSHKPVNLPCLAAAALSSRAATVSLGNAHAQEDEPLAVTADGEGWRYPTGAGGGEGRMRTLDRGGLEEAAKEVVCLPNREDAVRGADRVDADFEVGEKNAGDALEEDADAEEEDEACLGSYRHKMDSGCRLEVKKVC